MTRRRDAVPHPALSSNRLERDLYWGMHLFLQWLQHKSIFEFRGNAKGRGFRGYLAENQIPVRRAYRLIRRYSKMQRIWDRVTAANQELWHEVFPPEDLEKLKAGLARMRDRGGVTNDKVH